MHNTHYSYMANSIPNIPFVLPETVVLFAKHQTTLADPGGGPRGPCPPPPQLKNIIEACVGNDTNDRVLS